MRKQAVLIVSSIIGLLTAFGILITPEQADAILAVVAAVVPVVGALYARSQVASKDTVNKELGEPVEQQLFNK